MQDMREAVERDEFPAFVKAFMAEQFDKSDEIPLWIRESLAAVNVVL